MANEVIGIEVAVKLDQLRAQLATLGPGMEKEAAAMTAALNKQLKEQTAAVKAQTAAMTAAQRSGIKEIGDQAADAGTKFDKLGKAMGPLGGVLSKISPQAGAVASSIAGLTSGMEGLGAAGVLSTVAMGPLLAVLAPVALGVGLVSASMSDAKDRAAAAATAMEGLTRAMERTDSMTEAAADAMSDFRVMIGELTPVEAAYQKAIKQVAKEYTLANNELEELIRLRIESNEEVGLLADVQALRAQRAALVASTEARAKALSGQKEWTEQMMKSADFIAARDKAAAEGDKEAAAAKAKADALDKAVEDENERISKARYAEHIAATKQTIEHQEREREKRLEITKTIIDGEKAEREEAQKTADEQKKHDDDRRAAGQQRIQDAATVTDSIMALGNQLLQNEINNLDTSTKEGRKTAMDLWHVQQGLAIARAVLDAVAAISAASTLVPPASYVAMTVAGITGAINIAAVAGTPPPKFHAGGLSPDESPVTMRRGEAMLSGQGRRALGDDTIREANAGRGDSGGGAQRGQIVYKHRAFEYFVADHLQMNGTLAKTIRKGDRVGQLRRGRA